LQINSQYVKVKNIFGDDEKSKGKIAGLRSEEKAMVEELKPFRRF
jgi:DNA polymerase-3 subunit alpha